MKRKLLLTLAVACLFTCILAIGVSADSIAVNTITSDTYGTVYQLSADPGLDNAKNYVSVLNTIDDLAKDQEALSVVTDGTYYYVFPSSYLLDEHTSREVGKFSITLKMGAGSNYSSTQKGINDVFAEWNEAEGTSLPMFEYSGSWGSTKVDCIVRFEFPTDVKFMHKSHCLLKSVNLVEVIYHPDVSIASATGGMSGCTALTTVVLPTCITSIPESFFNGCTSLVNLVNWDEVKDNVTSLGASAFYNCDSLVSISLPALTSIGKHALAYCDKLETVDLIGASFVTLNAAFRDCPKLDGIVLPDTCNGISQDAFHNCKSLTYIKIPAACTSIGGYAFNNCISLAEIDMSEAVNLKSTGNSSFGSVIVTELIFPEGFESFGGITCSTLKVLEFPDSTTKLSIIKAGITEFRVPLGVTSLCSKQFDYCGSLQSVTLHKGITSFVTGNNPSFFGTTKTNLKTIYYTGSESDEFIINVKADVPGATIVYVDQCETYFGTHAWTGNATMQKIDYFSGVFFADSCTREGCGVNAIDDSKTIGAMFVDYGYSVTEAPINGVYSMSQFYGINRGAIEQYRAINPEFDFGFVVSASADPFGALANGELTADKVFIAEEKLFAYDYVSVKISGISGVAMEKAVAFCMFVKDGEATYYLDGGKTADMVDIKSYNDLVSAEQ